MNPVFWVIVILFLVAVWMALVGKFNSIGKQIKDHFKNIYSVLNEEDEENNDEEE